MTTTDWTAGRIAAAVRDGEISAREVVDAALARIERYDGDVGAFLHVEQSGARRAAATVDNLPAAQRRTLPLAGVPVAVKDNVVTRDMPTTAASRILEGFRAPFDATVVARLRQAGALIVGKTNLDEFAMGSSTEHSAFHPTRNPWDLTRVPGGSSGGSAAAVAARMVPLALGSDTGGSIRQPAAYCGVVGMKPTYGRVSRFGLIAFASSLDQIGPLARTVADARLLYRVIAGSDPCDSTALEGDAGEGLDEAVSLNGLRIGLPREYFGDGTDRRIRSVVAHALDRLESSGARLVEVSLPHTPYAISTYYLIAMAEASSNLSRYDGVRYGMRAGGRDLLDMYETTRAEGFGAEVKRRILLGTHALSAGYYDAYYLKAQKVRTLIRQDFDTAFLEVDVIATPTTPDLPFRLGERETDPLQMYLSDIFTVTSNLAGIPSLVVPVGVADGLPVGLQWMAPPLADGRLLAIAELCEKTVAIEPNWPLGGTMS
ncbi:MAG: Asp-tRNA(Asn)/Glu-tRNA(Gln) amidotransferase subunit GatA [Thermaerobacter sp.]|nr:Asp-tRNA(Asn)/Glu-tRNA(Gln) amidotransferase subunit GatA [Thermaerobacter sp.]